MSTPWSDLGDTFLSEGDWAIGQGTDAPDRQLLRHLLRVLLDDEHERIHLLEVGSGPGIEVRGLREEGLLDRVDYVGYDFTPELVESCRQQHQDCRFEVVDAQKMRDEGVADIVWCRHLLEHVQDWERAFQNALRASRLATVISWFIRPTWKQSEVATGVAEGFIHHTVDAHEAIKIARPRGDLYRYDFDHHLVRASVWLISRDEKLPIAATRFFSSDQFLEALLPVPEHPHDVEVRQFLNEIADRAGRLVGND